MKAKLYKFERPPIHFVGKADIKFWPLLDFGELWDFCLKRLQQIFMSNDLHVISFVLMSNHFHLLAQGGEVDNSALFLFVRSIENFLCDHIKINSRAHKVTNIRQYRSVYKYIYRNPVEAGLVSNVQDYAYSSLRSILGLSKDHYPFYDNMNLLTNPFNVLRWLNSKDECAELFYPNWRNTNAAP